MSDNLFLLINSLSKSEKGYFKKYTSLHIKGQQNNYIKLFEAIDKQFIYNEQKIKHLLSKETLVKQFPKYKHYLYELILKSMRAYYASHNVVNQLYNLLLDSSFLFEKGLYHKCNLLVRKAKKIAYKHEKYSILLDILGWEMKLLNKLQYMPYLMEKTNSVLEERNSVEMKINIMNKSTQHYHTLYNHYSKYGVNNPAFLPKDIEYQIRDIENISNVPFTAWVHYLQSLGLYYRLKGDIKKSYTYRKQTVEYYESAPEQLNAHLTDYAIALNNLLVLQNKSNNIKEPDSTINKLLVLNKHISSANEGREIAYIIYNNLLHYYKNTAQFEKGIKLIKQLNFPINQLKLETTMMARIYGLLSNLYFGLGKYEEALNWIDKIMNNKSKILRKDILAITHLVNIVLHFELKNFILLESLILSTERFFRKTQNAHPLEHNILHYLKQLVLQQNNKQKFNKLFTELKEELASHEDTKHLKYVLGFFDFESWVKSKTENRSFSEIVKLKSGDTR